MSRPFYQPDPAWWPALAALIPKPWPKEAIYQDLCWWQDQEHAGRSTRPGRPALVARWGVTDWTAKQALLAEDEWGDARKVNPDRQPTASRPPVSRQPTASAPPAATSSQADNHEEPASAPTADHQPTASAPPANRPTRVGSQPTTHNPQPTEDNSDPQAARADTRPPLVLLAAVPEADEPEAEPVPPWSGKVAASAKSGGRKVKPAEVAAAFVEALSALRGAAVNPARCATDATPLAALWRAEGFPPLAEFVAEAVLVGKAARESKNPLFARDIRAEGWAEGVDRSRSVATLTVQARWQDRVRAARAEFGGGPAGAALPTANPAPTATSPGALAWADMLTHPHVAAPFPEFIGWIVRSPAQWSDPKKVKLAADPVEHGRRLKAFAGAGALGMRWESDHRLPDQRERIRLDFITRYEAAP